MKFISLNGSTCSGKSSIIKRVMEERENLFKLSYDSLKWQFSRYVPSEKFNDVHSVMLAELESLCKMKYDIISDSGLYQEWREKLLSIPHAYSYDVVEINIEAEYDVLAQRFDKRIASALANPEKKISNTSKERFKELHDIYQREKNPAALTFHSDQESIEEIARKILALF